MNKKIKNILKFFFGKLYVLTINQYNSFRVIGKQKIFCIGLNKTGTTSLNKALVDLGIVVASESEAKPLFKSWVKRDFKSIIKFCKRAQAFQDSPFSFPYTFETLDKAYPNSKFILTIRDSDEQWYHSITNFHSKLWGNNDGIPPNKEMLQKAFNAYKGRPWDVNRALFNTPESEPYKKDDLLYFYNSYNESVINYFRVNPDRLLVINLSEKKTYKKFVEFLGVEAPYSDFPWENKT
jgi:hypothetical protein